MATTAELRFLEERGWAVQGKSFDLCWLDCDKDGWLKTLARAGQKPLCICLCPDHALCLEAGVYAGDYIGAPLPTETKADEWPWQPCSDVL